MAVINELPTQSGGKWELLWTNPNPTGNFSSNVTINVDTSEYEQFFAFVKMTSGSTQSSIYVSLTKDASSSFGLMSISTINSAGASSSSDRVLRFRRYQIYSDRIVIYGGSSVAGYIYIGTGSKDTNRQDVCIPTAVYGVKRLNLG